MIPKQYVNLGLDTNQIHQFLLQSAESSILADGIFSFHGNEDLNLEIKNLNLIKIPGLHLIPLKLSGMINAKTNLSGNADSPVF
jgi:hypothetical protein